jgi:polysaccharide pyruvyl transferase WcaK-like protein
VPLTIGRLCQAAPRHGFYAVGAGPLNSRLGRALISRAASRAVHVSVRDEGSRTVLHRAGVEREISVSADPAVELQSCPDAAARGLIREAGLDPDLPTVAVSPCAWHSMEQYYARQAEPRERVRGVLSELARRVLGEVGAQVLLVPTMWPEDASVALDVVAQTADDRVGALARQPSGPEAQGVIGMCQALVSMRLHPAIFALNAATPAVTVVYDRKVAAFMKQIGASEFAVPLASFTAERLLPDVRRALGAPPETRERLAQAHREQCARARETAVQVAGDIDRRAIREAR